MHIQLWNFEDTLIIFLWEKFAPYKDRPGMNTIYLSLLELKKGNVIEALDIVKKMGTVNK